jgi:hypothetical protein
MRIQWAELGRGIAEFVGLVVGMVGILLGIPMLAEVLRP